MALPRRARITAVARLQLRVFEIGSRPDFACGRLSLGSYYL